MVNDRICDYKWLPKYIGTVANQVEIISFFKIAMVIVGIVFVVNSLDSLMRLYTVNLNLTVERFGRRKYILGNWAAMFGLILMACDTSRT